MSAVDAVCALAHWCATAASDTTTLYLNLERVVTTVQSERGSGLRRLELNLTEDMYTQEQVMTPLRKMVIEELGLFPRSAWRRSAYWVPMRQAVPGLDKPPPAPLLQHPGCGRVFTSLDNRSYFNDDSEGSDDQEFSEEDSDPEEPEDVYTFSVRHYNRLREFCWAGTDARWDLLAPVLVRALLTSVPEEAALVASTCLYCTGWRDHKYKYTEPAFEEAEDEKSAAVPPLVLEENLDETAFASAVVADCSRMRSRPGFCGFLKPYQAGALLGVSVTPSSAGGDGFHLVFHLDTRSFRDKDAAVGALWAVFGQHPLLSETTEDLGMTLELAGPVTHQFELDTADLYGVLANLATFTRGGPREYYRCVPFMVFPEGLAVPDADVGGWDPAASPWWAKLQYLCGDGADPFPALLIAGP